MAISRRDVLKGVVGASGWAPRPAVRRSAAGSCVHATIAGVLLGLAVPVQGRSRDDRLNGLGLAEHFEHRLRPLLAGVAVPVFAFFAAGVGLGGVSGITDAFPDRVTLGIVIGLVVGKTVGILGTTYLLARFTHASLDPDLLWLDLVGFSLLTGIGFTVSLLIGGPAPTTSRSPYSPDTYSPRY